MINLKDIITRAQTNDEKMMLYLIEIFTPLLNGLTKLFADTEDARSELTLGFIETIYNLKIPEFRNEINNYVLISYIQKSMYHKYIGFHRKEQNRTQNEIPYANLIENSETDLHTVPFDERILLNESIKVLLTPKEYKCIINIIFNGHTATEIAKENHISKQAINQCKHRALHKIKRNYFDN